MKFNRPLLIVAVFLIGCNEDNHKSRVQNNIEEKVVPADTTKNGLPFVGKKRFETRPGISGTGTPHRYVDIRKNGDVHFSYEQENQSNKDITFESYYAGKFSKYLKCIFKTLDSEVRYYEITKSEIYEVDSNHTRLTNEDCCTSSNYELESKCPCSGPFDE